MGMVIHSDFQYTFDWPNKVKYHVVAREEWGTFQKGQVPFPSLKRKFSFLLPGFHFSCFKSLKEYLPGRYFGQQLCPWLNVVFCGSEEEIIVSVTKQVWRHELIAHPLCGNGHT